MSEDRNRSEDFGLRRNAFIVQPRKFCQTQPCEKVNDAICLRGEALSNCTPGLMFCPICHNFDQDQPLEPVYEFSYQVFAEDKEVVEAQYPNPKDLSLGFIPRNREGMGGD